MPGAMSDVERIRLIAALAVTGVVAGLVVFFPLRVLVRGMRLKRFAKRHGFVCSGKHTALPAWWSDLACLQMGTNGRAVNCFQGERHGRPFVAFDFHYDLPPFGMEARAYRSVPSAGGLLWQRPVVSIDRASDPGFSAAVVECSIPSGTRTTHVKQALSPWRAEFGAVASVIRCDDGYCSSAELLAAVDLLNAALDEILAAPPPAA